MGYVRDLVNGQIRLEGDGFGAAWARIQLPAAPPGAKKMQVVFRAWYDTISGITTSTGKGWNHSACFGLRFSSGIPKYPAAFTAPFTAWLPTDFFGMILLGPASNDNTAPLSGTPIFYTDAGMASRGNGPTMTAGNGFTTADYLGQMHNNTGSYFEHWGFMNGIGGVQFTALTPALGVYSQAQALALPANPTTGAKFTGFWEIWASEADRTMYARTGLNGQSLIGDAMFNAIDTNYGATQFTVHGDTASGFRGSFDTVNFPRWLVMRHAHDAIDLVFQEARVRYFDWANNELEA